MECFRFFRLWIFAHLCVLFLRFEHRIRLAETKICFYSRQRRWFLGRQKSRAEPLEIICKQFRHIFVILCAIRFSESFFKKLIVSTLRKPNYTRKYIKEDLIKVLFDLFNKKPLHYIFMYLKKQSGVRCELVLYSHFIRKNITNKLLNLGAHAFSCDFETYEDCQFEVVGNM